MKGILNKRLEITTGNLNKIIPELNEVIESIPKNGRTNQEVLHIALQQLGWSQNDIKNLQKKKKSLTSGREVSPSFKFYKPKDATGTLKRGQLYKSVPGGSPGLGKKK